MRKLAVNSLLCLVISTFSHQQQFCVICPHTGLDAELYYVRDDVVNYYALSFNMPVPTETNSLYFTWYSKMKVSLGILSVHVFTQLLLKC